MLVQQGDCIGCGVCSISCSRKCIEMVQDKKGFVYPAIDNDRCISCKKCEAVCPILNPIVETETNTCLAVKNIDNNERKISSSGGVFIAMAEKVLEDNGAVCAAAYDESLTVVHRIVQSKEQVPYLCGAKYAQSRFDPCLLEVKALLQDGKTVLFIGTPCQVGAIEGGLTETEKENIILVDFICHGVPSPVVFQKYLSELSRDYAKGSPIISVNMRDKATGWSNYSYCMTVEFENGVKYQKLNREEMFLQGFVNDLFLRDSCYNCAFKGRHRASDLTLGDCWGIWNIDSDFDDNLGTSLLQIHTKRGLNYWNLISSQFNVTDFDERDAIKYNPSAVKSATAHVNKDTFWNLVNQGVDVGKAIQECLYEEQKEDSLLGHLKVRVKKLLFRKE